MAHKEQMDFCNTVKRKFPEYFKEKTVLDIGSLDINGSNKEFFDDCEYTGLDLAEGKNVDVISFAHEYHPEEPFDVVVSTEVFEHDYYFPQTLSHCIELTKSGGLFFFSAAGPERAEHGTKRTTPNDSPFTSFIEGQENYYKNITLEWVHELVDLDATFSEWDMAYGRKDNDIYFWGIKKEVADENESS